MIGQSRCPSLLPRGRNCRGRNACPPKRFPASRQTLCCRPLQLPKARGPELLRRLEKRKKRGEDREQVLTAQQGAQPRPYLSVCSSCIAAWHRFGGEHTELSKTPLTGL